VHYPLVSGSCPLFAIHCGLFCNFLHPLSPVPKDPSAGRRMVVGMRWFRSNIHLGSRLALFALAVQMALSLGHIHFDAVAPASAKSALPAVVAGSGAELPSTRTPIHKSGGLIDPHCPICAFIQLLTTSAPSAAPALPLPPTINLIGLRAPVDLALAPRPPLLFQARAPPSI
jgi:hypothetical protein